MAFSNLRIFLTAMMHQKVDQTHTANVFAKKFYHKLRQKQQFRILKQYKRVNAKVDEVLTTQAVCAGTFKH